MVKSTVGTFETRFFVQRPPVIQGQRDHGLFSAETLSTSDTNGGLGLGKESQKNEELTEVS